MVQSLNTVCSNGSQFGNHKVNEFTFQHVPLFLVNEFTLSITQGDPGLMVLSLNTVFDFIKNDKSSDEFEVTCYYLEVYNEV